MTIRPSSPISPCPPLNRRSLKRTWFIPLFPPPSGYLPPEPVTPKE